MKNRLSRSLVVALGLLVGVSVMGYYFVRSRTAMPSPVNPVVAGSGAAVTLMDFSEPLDPDDPPPGWWHRTFLTTPAMTLSVVEKSGVKALRCETSGSGSIFGRFVDVDLGQFPNLKWSWLVEKPVVAAIAETEQKGDDHPARFFVQFADTEKAEHHLEIIWSNGAFQIGQWKIIGGFHHYVANGGDARSGEKANQWFDETVNLVDIYRFATKREDTPRLTNISIFCDTDDTDAESVAYFGKVTLEK